MYWLGGKAFELSYSSKTIKHSGDPYVTHLVRSLRSWLNVDTGKFQLIGSFYFTYNMKYPVKYKFYRKYSDQLGKDIKHQLFFVATINDLSGQCQSDTTKTIIKLLKENKWEMATLKCGEELVLQEVVPEAIIFLWPSEVVTLGHFVTVGDLQLHVSNKNIPGTILRQFQKNVYELMHTGGSLTVGRAAKHVTISLSRLKLINENDMCSIKVRGEGDGRWGNNIGITLIVDRQ